MRSSLPIQALHSWISFEYSYHELPHRNSLLFTPSQCIFWCVHSGMSQNKLNCFCEMILLILAVCHWFKPQRCLLCRMHISAFLIDSSPACFLVPSGLIPWEIFCFTPVFRPPRWTYYFRWHLICVKPISCTLTLHVQSQNEFSLISFLGNISKYIIIVSYIFFKIGQKIGGYMRRKFFKLPRSSQYCWAQNFLEVELKVLTVCSICIFISN